MSDLDDAVKRLSKLNLHPSEIIIGNIAALIHQIEGDVRKTIDAAIAAEREACAKIADEEAKHWDEEGPFACETIASAIRSRTGETK